MQQLFSLLLASLLLLIVFSVLGIRITRLVKTCNSKDYVNFGIQNIKKPASAAGFFM